MGDAHLDWVKVSVHHSKEWSVPLKIDLSSENDGSQVVDLLSMSKESPKLKLPDPAEHAFVFRSNRLPVTKPGREALQKAFKTFLVTSTIRMPMKVPNSWTQAMVWLFHRMLKRTYHVG